MSGSTPTILTEIRAKDIKVRDIIKENNTLDGDVFLVTHIDTKPRTFHIQKLNPVDKTFMDARTIDNVQSNAKYYRIDCNAQLTSSVADTKGGSRHSRRKHHKRKTTQPTRKHRKL